MGERRILVIGAQCAAYGEAAWLPFLPQTAQDLYAVMTGESGEKFKLQLDLPRSRRPKRRLLAEVEGILAWRPSDQVEGHVKLAGARKARRKGYPRPLMPNELPTG
jgi:hypothetical protein